MAYVGLVLPVLINLIGIPLVFIAFIYAGSLVYKFFLEPLLEKCGLEERSRPGVALIMFLPVLCFVPFLHYGIAGWAAPRLTGGSNETCTPAGVAVLLGISSTTAMHVREIPFPSFCGVDEAELMGYGDARVGKKCCVPAIRGNFSCPNFALVPNPVFAVTILEDAATRASYVDCCPLMGRAPAMIPPGFASMGVSAVVGVVVNLVLNGLILLWERIAAAASCSAAVGDAAVHPVLVRKQSIASQRRTSSGAADDHREQRPPGLASRHVEDEVSNDVTELQVAQNTNSTLPEKLHVATSAAAPASAVNNKSNPWEGWTGSYIDLRENENATHHMHAIGGSRSSDVLWASVSEGVSADLVIKRVDPDETDPSQWRVLCTVRRSKFDAYNPVAAAFTKNATSLVIALDYGCSFSEVNVNDGSVTKVNGPASTRRERSPSTQARDVPAGYQLDFAPTSEQLRASTLFTTTTLMCSEDGYFVLACVRQNIFWASNPSNSVSYSAVLWRRNGENNVGEGATQSSWSVTQIDHIVAVAMNRAGTAMVCLFDDGGVWRYDLIAARGSMDAAGVSTLSVVVPTKLPPLDVGHGGGGAGGGGAPGGFSLATLLTRDVDSSKFPFSIAVSEDGLVVAVSAHGCIGVLHLLEQSCDGEVQWSYEKGAAEVMHFTEGGSRMIAMYAGFTTSYFVLPGYGLEFCFRIRSFSAPDDDAVHRSVCTTLDNGELLFVANGARGSPTGQLWNLQDNNSALKKDPHLAFNLFSSQLFDISALTMTKCAVGVAIGFVTAMSTTSVTWHSYQNFGVAIINSAIVSSISDLLSTYTVYAFMLRPHTLYTVEYTLRDNRAGYGSFLNASLRWTLTKIGTLARNVIKLTIFFLGIVPIGLFGVTHWVAGLVLFSPTIFPLLCPFAGAILLVGLAQRFLFEATAVEKHRWQSGAQLHVRRAVQMLSYLVLSVLVNILFTVLVRFPINHMFVYTGMSSYPYLPSTALHSVQGTYAGLYNIIFHLLQMSSNTCAALRQVDNALRSVNYYANLF